MHLCSRLVVLQRLKFGKVIRYESRKQLAQQRPRVKGQFVKHSAGLGSDAAGVGAPGITGPAGDEARAVQAQAGYGGQNFDVSCLVPSAGWVRAVEASWQ